MIWTYHEIEEVLLAGQILLIRGNRLNAGCAEELCDKKYEMTSSLNKYYLRTSGYVLYEHSLNKIQYIINSYKVNFSRGLMVDTSASDWMCTE